MSIHCTHNPIMVCETCERKPTYLTHCLSDGKALEYPQLLRRWAFCNEACRQAYIHDLLAEAGVKEPNILALSMMIQSVCQ